MMLFSRSIRSLLAGTVLAVALTGAAALASPGASQGPGLQELGMRFPVAQPLAGPGFMKPHAKGAQLLYLADANHSVVDIYLLANLSQLGQLTSKNGVAVPSGIYIDPTGDLYVTSYYGYISVYHEGSLHPYMTWYGNGWTWDVATCGKTVYATEYGRNTIFEYGPNSQYPIGTLHDTNMRSLYGITVDSKCDIFVSGYEVSGPVAVDEFPHGQHTQKTVQTIGSGAAGLLAIDPKGNLLFDNPGQGLGQICYFCYSTITTYAPPYTGSPISTASFLGQFYAFALTPDGQSIWAGDLNPYGYYGYYYCYMNGQKFSLGGSLEASASTVYDCGLSFWGAAASPHNHIGP